MALRCETDPSHLILSLPRDVVDQELTQWLQPIDLCHIGATCRHLRRFLDDNGLWGRLVVSTFGSNWACTQLNLNHTIAHIHSFQAFLSHQTHSQVLISSSSRKRHLLDIFAMSTHCCMHLKCVSNHVEVCQRARAESVKSSFSASLVWERHDSLFDSSKKDFYSDFPILEWTFGRLMQK
jgi:hypothetical protein